MRTHQIITRCKLGLLGLLSSALFVSPVTAQVFDLGPSDPALFDVVIDAGLNTGPDPTSVGGDGLTTQLNVSNGALLLGFSFDANAGSEVNIRGGNFDSGFDAHAGSEVNISGGFVGPSFDALLGSAVTISGGTIGDSFTAEVDTVVNISGGNIGRFFNANGGSEINISGGSFESGFNANNGSVVEFSGGSISDTFDANAGSVVNISGGSIGDHINIGIVVFSFNPATSDAVVNISGGTFGDDFDVLDDSTVNLLGSNFVLDGVLLDDTLTPGVPFTIADRDVPFSGLLSDGSPISLDLNTDLDSFRTDADAFSSEATLTITLVSPVPEPGTLSLLGLGCVMLLVRRHKACC